MRYTLDYNRLWRHLKKGYQLEGMSQNQLCKELNLTRATLWRVQIGKPITMESFCKIIDWLDSCPSNYIKKQL